MAAKTPYPAYVLRGAAFVAGWRRKRLIRPTCCGVSLLLPDGGETPYPAYVLRGAAFVAGWRRKRLIRPTCCEVLPFIAGWRRKALSGLRVAVCGFCCRMAAKTPYPAYEWRGVAVMLRVLLL